MARERDPHDAGSRLGEAAGERAQDVDPDFGAGATAGLTDADEAPTDFGAGAASSIRMDAPPAGGDDPGDGLGSLVGGLVDDLLGSDPSEVAAPGTDDDVVGGRLGDAAGALADDQAGVGGDDGDAMDDFA